MSRTPCEFHDPVADTTYEWPVNYLQQEGPARVSNVSYDSQASALGVIATEGEVAPLVLTLSGTILHKEQHLTFLTYFRLEHTFRYTDEEGNEFEVTMLSYEPTKERVRWNPRDPDMRMHKWTYKMALRVVRIIDGDYEDVIDP